jgi:ribonuclease P protein component
MTPQTPIFRFPQHLRLKTPAQFKAVYDLKKSVSDRRLVVYVAANGLPHPRLGLSVSRKVGNAVVRNRYKRLYREAFRLTQHELPAGLDLILIPRVGPTKPSLEELKTALLRLASDAERKVRMMPRPNQSANAEGRP